MKLFEVSQAEKWHRIYRLRANTLEEAKVEYERLARLGDPNAYETVKDPEYVEDILDDQLWTEIIETKEVTPWP